MSRLGRLAGALLFETRGSSGEPRYFLIGNTKEPCDFPAQGFEAPGTIDALRRPVLPLSATRAIELAAPWLELDGEGELTAGQIAERLLITRNGSVSDRLWRIILRPEGIADGDFDADGDGEQRDAVRAQWLLDMPAPVWGIVRDTVLRCV